MKKVKKNTKIITVGLLLILMISLLIYGIYYAIKNYNRGDIKTINDIPATYSIGSDQLDKLEQPEVSETITLDTLPEAKEILQNISLKDIKKLFKTSKKSILFLVKNDCAYCDGFMPIIKDVLKELNINAYLINISEISINDYDELLNYINFSSTPTSYIIQNSKVLHTLSGSVDKDTLKSFIDYFYIRNN